MKQQQAGGLPSANKGSEYVMFLDRIYSSNLQPFAKIPSRPFTLRMAISRVTKALHETFQKLIIRQLITATTHIAVAKFGKHHPRKRRRLVCDEDLYDVFGSTLIGLFEIL